MKKKKYLLAGAWITICIVLGEPFTASAQETIRGTVLSAEDDRPLPGATVKIDGTQLGANTDEDGRFALQASGNEFRLSITSLGYLPLDTILRLPLRGQLVISLHPNASMLDETVVIGYGTTTKRLNTGSVSRITAEEIASQPVANPLAALMGRVPGLVVTQTTGLPGGAFKVQIRGRNSIAQGNDPLFIIDGVPYAPNNTSINRVGSAVGPEGLSPFNSINPANIESIEILKDADATAIYGSRGANGVVLITTKKGKPGKTRIDLRVSTGASKITRGTDWLNTRQYIEMRKEAFSNDEIALNDANAYDILVWDTTRYTNWQEELIGGTASTTDLQASISGGTEHVQFLVGAGYRKATTVYPGDMADRRASVHFNVGHQAPNRRFTLNFSGIYSYDKNNLITGDLARGVASIPNLPPLYDENGKLSWSYRGYSFINPMASLKDEYDARTANLLGNLYASYSIAKNLSINVNLGYNAVNIDEIRINPIASSDPARNPTGASQFGFSNLSSLITEPQFKYNLRIGKGNLQALLGGSWQQNISKNTFIRASGYSNDALLRSVSGASELNSSDSYSEYRYAALFGRLRYNWENKYIINLTGRRDGSSRFGPGKQFANFGAVGAAWIFSNESLVGYNLAAISHGKLRVSYGTSGNDAIGDYQYLDTYGPSRYPYQGKAGVYPTRLYNADYAWEINKKLEIALEIGFLRDKLLITGAYFRNRSANQLLSVDLPSQTGFGGITENLPALVQNTGLELELFFNNLRAGNFSWSSSLSLTLPNNKLLAYPDLEVSAYRNRYEIGKSLNVERGYHVTDEVDPETGNYRFIINNGEISDAPVYPDDIVKGIADLTPECFGGFHNQITYKNMQLDFLWTFRKQAGNSYLKSRISTSPPGMINNNQPAIVLNRWRNPGDQTSIARFTQDYNGDTYQSIRHILYYGGSNLYEDASFIRLKNVMLSYNLPAAWLSSLNIRQFRLFLQGQNLLTITGYYGGDPETQSPTSMPPLKTLAFGFNMSI